MSDHELIGVCERNEFTWANDLLCGNWNGSGRFSGMNGMVDVCANLPYLDDALVVLY